MKPEVWIFVDERVDRGETSHRFFVGCVVVGRGSWQTLHGEAKRISASRRTRRLDLIADLLDRTRGFALVAYADLSVELVPSGEVDGTDDIPRMKRWDNVWSQAVLAAAVAVLSCLRTSGVEAADIDLYYDVKSLTLAHRDAYEKTLREKLPDIAREDPETGALQPSPTFVFRRVEQISKRRREVKADQLQDGTAVAHHLCSQVHELIDGPRVPRIVVRNNTNALRNMISKWRSS